ncbi:hypothetical protein R6Q59_026311 [Mikania micrantha]
MNAQCRKVLKDGENSKKRRKKSPKISRIEPSGTRKAQQQQQSRFKSLREDKLQGPPSRTRASLRRRHHEPSSTKLQVEKKLKQEDQSLKGETDATIEEPSPAIAQPLPDKQILELIIDTLQRKDIYEIFAKPVDPEEVEDYYEIIEEPMDFGTMRAKLHEGFYTSLEQFEEAVEMVKDVIPLKWIEEPLINQTWTSTMTSGVSCVNLTNSNTTNIFIRVKNINPSQDTPKIM